MRERREGEREGGGRGREVERREGGILYIHTYVRAVGDDKGVHISSGSAHCIHHLQESNRSQRRKEEERREEEGRRRGEGGGEEGGGGKEERKEEERKEEDRRKEGVVRREKDSGKEGKE